MKLLNRVGDALVARLAPKATAEAAPCEYYKPECRGIYLYYCWYDRCQGNKFLSCSYQGKGS